MDEKTLLLAKIASMYYMDGLSQQEIATITKLSRPTISRSLDEARRRGIVEIRVISPVSRHYDLEKKLKERFNIKDAIVVAVLSTKDENILKSLGEAGAHYLLDNVCDGTIIGFSMGKTLYEVAEKLSEKATSINKKVKCKVVPIVGGSGLVEPHVHANELCRKLSGALGGEFYPLYAPAIAEDKRTKEAFIEDSMVQRVLDMTLNADITFVSVGNIGSSTFERIGSIKKEEVESLIESGIIGDIASWFFDKNGNFPDVEINNRVVGADFNKIRSRSKIVLVAGTDSKRKIIKATLQGNWVDTLITDENVARFLIEN